LIYFFQPCQVTLFGCRKNGLLTKHQNLMLGWGIPLAIVLVIQLSNEKSSLLRSVYTKEQNLCRATQKLCRTAQKFVPNDPICVARLICNLCHKTQNLCRTAQKLCRRTQNLCCTTQKLCRTIQFVLYDPSRSPHNPKSVVRHKFLLFRVNDPLLQSYFATAELLQFANSESNFSGAFSKLLLPVQKSFQSCP
jgi:hypothetical protein